MNWNKLHYLNKSILDIPNEPKSLRLIYEELLLDVAYIFIYFSLSTYFFFLNTISNYWELIIILGIFIYEILY